MTTTWDDFKQLWRRISDLQKLVAMTSASIAGFSALTPIAPPMDRATVGFLSALISIFAVSVVFLGYRRRKRKDATAIRYLFAIFIICLIGYLLLHSTLIFRSEVLQADVVRGLWCNPEKAVKIPALAARCPLLSEQDLQGNDFNLDFFWTPGAVVVSRGLLLTLWFFAVGVLSVSAAIFSLSTRTQNKPKHLTNNEQA